MEQSIANANDTPHALHRNIRTRRALRHIGVTCQAHRRIQKPLKTSAPKNSPRPCEVGKRLIFREELRVYSLARMLRANEHLSVKTPPQLYPERLCARGALSPQDRPHLPRYFASLRAVVYGLTDAMAALGSDASSVETDMSIE